MLWGVHRTVSEVAEGTPREQSLDLKGPGRPSLRTNTSYLNASHGMPSQIIEMVNLRQTLKIKAFNKYPLPAEAMLNRHFPTSMSVVYMLPRLMLLTFVDP